MIRPLQIHLLPRPIHRPIHHLAHPRRHLLWRASHLQHILAGTPCFLLLFRGGVFDGAHDGTFKAHAETGGDALVKGLGEGAAEVGVVKGGEEAEGAEGEGGDGGDDALEEPAAVQDCAVAAQLSRVNTAQGLGVYGDDKIEEVGLTETDFWGPEFDFLRRRWEFFLETVVVEGRGSLEFGIDVSPVSQRPIEGVHSISLLLRSGMLEEELSDFLCKGDKRGIILLGDDDNRLDTKLHPSTASPPLASKALEHTKSFRQFTNPERHITQLLLCHAAIPAIPSVRPLVDDLEHTPPRQILAAPPSRRTPRPAILQEGMHKARRLALVLA